MTEIPTANGIIDSAKLGRTLVHEHVFVLGEEYRVNYAKWDEEAEIDNAVKQLDELNTRGIDTILDPTVLGLGRYIPRIQAVASRTPVNIVVATGLYTMNDIPFQFMNRGPRLMIDEPEMLTEMFVRDLTQGIADTGVRAAFLKCVIDSAGLTPGVERVMRAVGQASVQTGAPITVHTSPAERTGEIAQKVLASEGVALDRVVLGHSGDTADVDHLSELAESGSYLGMDRFGVDVYLSLAERVRTVVELVRRGFLERIVVSHDYSCTIDYFTHPDDRKQVGELWNFTYVSDYVIPALLEAGLTESDIDTILVDNPRRHFEG